MDRRRLIGLLLAGWLSPVWSGSLTLDWDAPTTLTDGSPIPSGALAGYNLGYGTSSGNYSTTLTLGNVVTYTLTGLDGATRYYIAVKARANTGYEDSNWSNEVNSLGDIAAPVRTAILGSTVAYAASLTWGVTTDETATCRYSAASGTPYANMTAFATTGGTTHGNTLTPPGDGSIHKYYVICTDPYGNMNATELETAFVVQARPKLGAPGR